VEGKGSSLGKGQKALKKWGGKGVALEKGSHEGVKSETEKKKKGGVVG